MAKTKAKRQKFIPCSVKRLPEALEVAAAEHAVKTNPANAPAAGLLALMSVALDDGAPPPPWHLAVTRYWGVEGVRLTVGFMEPLQAALRDKILSYMNRWSEFCNVKFSWTQASPQVRISRGRGGYWSYLGPDILQVPANQQTMNLEGFTLQTPESEFGRVIPHEAGHTLGFSHEHMRRELVDRLDPQKTIDYFRRTQGWSADMVRQQVLTPLEESSFTDATAHADQDSIMCYSLPGSITKDGKPITGGVDIDADDKAFAAKIYPLAVVPPPPPGGGGSAYTIVVEGAKKISVNGREINP